MHPIDKMLELEQMAREFGFDWPDSASILDQVLSEYQEARDDIENKADISKIQEEVGDLIHAAISLCVFMKLDVKDTVAKTNNKFAARMDVVIKLAKERGLNDLKGQSIEMMMELWREAKKATSESHYF